MAELEVHRGDAVDLEPFLADKSNFVVARAAELAKAGDAKLLERAFFRFLEGEDKTCAAKIAIARALDDLEIDAEEVFRAGVKHVQMEPAFGDPPFVDTAPLLRARCACAMTRRRYHDALELAVDLLADPERAARMGAAQALLCSGAHEAALLLRLKIMLGDESEVISECMNALLELSREQIPFVARFLEGPSFETAALALGQTRAPAAFEILKTRLETPGPAREVVSLAIAILRLPEATQLLIDRVAEGDRAAIKALAIYRDDPQIREKVEKALEDADMSVRRAYEDAFRGRKL